MNCRFNDNVTDAGQFDHDVRIPKHILGKLVDYFIFNTGDTMYFDGKGRLEGIEGVPVEITDLLKNIFDVRMSERELLEILESAVGDVGRDKLERLMDTD